MKKIYNLLLRVRELEERRRKRELSEAISLRLSKEREIAELENEKKKALSGIKENEEGISAWLLAQFLHYIEGLREEKKRKERELVQIMMVEDKKREEYMESRREREIAERLVERKKFQEFIEELRREEKISDELVASRHRNEGE